MFCTTWISYPHGFHIYLWGWKQGDLSILPQEVFGVGENAISLEDKHITEPWIGIAPFAAHEGKYIRYN